jgi:hypothetical protein
VEDRSLLCRVKGGSRYGPSDECGHKPADRTSPTEVYDIHTTILYLLGTDHSQLMARHDGSDQRLTDVHGPVIRDLMG